MRIIARVLVGAPLIAAALPAPASGAPYLLAHPRVDPSWGGRPGMPTAPSSTAGADSELPATLLGADRTAEYVRRMLASPPTLDQAISFHLYAPVQDIAPTVDVPRMKPETAAETDAVARKARAAEPGLLVELDGRFAALTTAVRRADSIVLPEPNPLQADPVLYCRFVYNAAGMPRPGLGEHLWDPLHRRPRCIPRRPCPKDGGARRHTRITSRAGSHTSGARPGVSTGRSRAVGDGVAR